MSRSNELKVEMSIDRDLFERLIDLEGPLEEVVWDFVDDVRDVVAVLERTEKIKLSDLERYSGVELQSEDPDETSFIQILESLGIVKEKGMRYTLSEKLQEE